MIQFIILSSVGGAPGCDTLDGIVVAELPLRDQGQALVLSLIVTTQVGYHFQLVFQFLGVSTEILVAPAGGGDNPNGVKQGRLPTGDALNHMAFLRTAGLVGIGIIGTQVESQGIGRFPTQLRDHVDPVLVHVLFAVEDVIEVAVTAGCGHRQAREELVSKGDVKNQGAIEPVVVTHPGLDGTLELFNGFVGGEHQRATGGVLAKQRPLGSTQNLY